ncbi:uncharacterized protein At4g02000-like [Arachis ipaensis]|uniref:uncharacterized protein At4g02000-like n=1 Tax=Arachis ipaensis TaxID=130454 RepID=UPI0007AF95F7|nr:uncharacterized protein At4g02000-like [Arachis ipaensis]
MATDLKRGPWSVKGYLINLKLWTQNESIHEVDHSFLEFWVQIHGLPLEYMNVETGKFIGERMGIVEEVEDPVKNNILARSFLRVRVAMEVTKALPTGFWMRRDNLPDARIHFKYERLQDSYCLNCGVLGHGRKECNNQAKAIHVAMEKEEE